MDNLNSDKKLSLEDKGSGHYSEDELEVIFDSLGITKSEERFLNELDTEKIVQAWRSVKRKKLFKTIE